MEPIADRGNSALEARMDAIEMIMQEHLQAERLFAELRGRFDEDRMEQLTELLTAHTEAEERVLNNVLRGFGKLIVIVD